jgi:hypothetical protein
MIKLGWICPANMLATFRHNMTMWAVFGLMAILWQQDLDPVGSFCVGTVATFFPCQNPQLWYCTMKQLLPLSLFFQMTKDMQYQHHGGAWSRLPL